MNTMITEVCTGTKPLTIFDRRQMYIMLCFSENTPQVHVNLSVRFEKVWKNAVAHPGTFPSLANLKLLQFVMEFKAFALRQPWKTVVLVVVYQIVRESPSQ